MEVTEILEAVRLAGELPVVLDMVAEEHQRAQATEEKEVLAGEVEDMVGMVGHMEGPIEVQRDRVVDTVEVQVTRVLLAEVRGGVERLEGGQAAHLLVQVRDGEVLLGRRVEVRAMAVKVLATRDRLRHLPLHLRHRHLVEATAELLGTRDLLLPLLHLHQVQVRDGEVLAQAQDHRDRLVQYLADTKAITAMALHPEKGLEVVARLATNQRLWASEILKLALVKSGMRTSTSLA